MKNSKIVSLLQIENSQNITNLLRGFSFVYSKNKNKSIVIDLRPNSNIIWSYYGRENIKYLDDILNIILDINIPMLKTFFTRDNDIVCAKDISKILDNDNFNFIIKALIEIYDNIFIATINNNYLQKILHITDFVLCPITYDPISLFNYKSIFSNIVINKIKDIEIFPVIFKTEIDFNIDEQETNLVPKNSIFINYSSKIEKGIQNKNFIFNDDKNDFVIGINNIINLLSKNNETDADTADINNYLKI